MILCSPLAARHLGTDHFPQRGLRAAQAAGWCRTRCAAAGLPRCTRAQKIGVGRTCCRSLDAAGLRSQVQLGVVAMLAGLSPPNPLHRIRAALNMLFLAPERHRDLGSSTADGPSTNGRLASQQLHLLSLTASLVSLSNLDPHQAGLGAQGCCHRVQHGRFGGGNVLTVLRCETGSKWRAFYLGWHAFCQGTSQEKYRIWATGKFLSIKLQKPNFSLDII